MKVLYQTTTILPETTALMYAARNNNIDLVKLLLAKDANPLLTDKDKKKASDKTTSPELKLLLLQAELNEMTKEILLSTNT